MSQMFSGKGQLCIYTRRMDRFGPVPVRLRTTVLLGALVGVLWGSAGGQAEASPGQPSAGSSGPLRPTKILWYSQPAGRGVTVRVAGGYCVGERPPTIVRIRIQEKPARGRQTGKAIVTVLLSGEEAPEPATVTGGEGPPEQVNLCLGVEHQIDSRIKFKRPVERLRIFDGSAAPPRSIPLRNAG